MSMYHEEEARFRTVYEHAGSGIATTDLSGTIEQCNPALCTLLGYNETELRSINFAALIHPEDRTPYLAELRCLQQGELPLLTIDGRLLHKDGRAVRVIQNISTIPDEKGQPAHLIALVTDLSRRQSDRVLRDSAEQLRLLVEQAPLAFAMFDRQMRYVAASRRWLSDYGFVSRDLRGISHYEVFPEIPDHWRDAHRRGLNGEVVRSEEDRFQRANGDIQWLRWEVRPWQDSSGETGGIVIFSEDITNRKAVEEEFRIERDKLRAVIDSVDVGISLVDPKGTFLLLNDAALRIYGAASRDDILTLSDRERFFEFWYPDGKIMPLDDWPCYRAMRGEHFREYDVVLAHHDAGVRRYVSFSAAPIWNDGGQLILYLISMNDLTKLKVAESSLRDSAAQQRAVVDSAVDSIIVIDDSGIIQSANPATRGIFGYSTSELIGQNISILMSKEHARAHDDYLATYKRTGVRKIIGIGREVVGKRKDGSPIPLDLAVAEWSDAAGRRFYTGIMRDISERKKIEEALSHAQRLDAVGRLAGGVAHDMNNLLAVIAGNLEIAEQLTQDQETHRVIQRAMEAVAAGTTFNRRLLSLTQRRKLEPHRLVLNTRVDHMVKLLERTLGADVELNAKLATDLWDVHCDPGEIDSALVNLAVNARDAMPDGGRLEIATRNVTLDTRASRLHPDARQGDYVRVSVIDTGFGMSPEVLKRAIDPFFTTKDPSKGAGLGLSSVCSFVKQSGGFVALASEQGKGTTVNLYLPRASYDPVTEPVAGAKDMPHGDGELILVVEDDDRLREITLKRLESLGYAVAEARSGPEAIKLLQSGEPIDVVFSDIVMPGKMTGYDVAQWIATMKPNIKVVLTTGYNEYDSKGDASAAGLKVPILDKPYTRQRLAQTMHSALLDQPA